MNDNQTRRWIYRWAIALAMFQLVLGSGCQPQKPAPLPAPPAVVSLNHFAGTPLSGPTTIQPQNVSTTDALFVRVTFIALERAPDRNFESLASRAKLISSTGGDSALLSSARLTREVQIVSLENPADVDAKLTAAHAGRTTPITILNTALPPGVTADFAVSEPLLLQNTLTNPPAQRRFRLDVWRPTAPGEPLRLAVELNAPATTPGGGAQSERAIVDLPSPDQDCLALMLPFAFANSETRAIATVIEIAPGVDDEAHDAALARCLEDVRKSIGTLADRPGALPGGGADWSSLQAAVASLDVPAARRTSLVFLAGRTGARCCEDVALVADDAVLTKLATQVRTTIGAVTSPQSDAAIGWTLDHTTFDLLAELLTAADASGAAPMSDELLATLATHAGEAGRHPSSMQQVLKHVSSREDLDNRLLAENLIFLEDSSPASRVRAFDWLTARGRAPEGYDPLAPPRERRRALEHGMAAAAAATTAPTKSAAGGAP